MKGKEEQQEIFLAHRSTKKGKNRATSTYAVENSESLKQKIKEI